LKRSRERFGLPQSAALWCKRNASSLTPDGNIPGESHCSPREIQEYLTRVSGPLL